MPSERAICAFVRESGEMRPLHITEPRISTLGIGGECNMAFLTMIAQV